MTTVDPLSSSLYFSATAQVASQNQVAKRKNEDGKKVKKGFFAELLAEAEEAENSPKLTGVPQEIASMPYEKAVETLLDAVYSSGDDLKKMQTLDMVQKYREAVKHFITYVVKTCYQKEIHESSRLIKRRKKFFQYEVIDAKLDKLAAEVLINQREQISFLAKIDEINGILVDLIT